jgi:hypothetical protein
MVHHSRVLETETGHSRRKCQKLCCAHSKRYPVEAGNRATSLNLAGKQGQLSFAPVGRDHEGTIRISGPRLRSCHRLTAKHLGVPRRRAEAVGDIQLDVVQGEARLTGSAQILIPACSPQDTGTRPGATSGS